MKKSNCLTENISNSFNAKGGEEGRDEGVLQERRILEEADGAKTGHSPALHR